VGVHHKPQLRYSLAGLIGRGTDQLARRSGPAWAASQRDVRQCRGVIIATVALRTPIELGSKPSINSTQHLGNLLLVLACRSRGRARTPMQKFHSTSATNTAAMPSSASSRW